MKRNEILKAIHGNFGEFLHIWLEHRQDRGLGALVFTSEEESGSDEELSCEYWTLNELRHYLRRMQECDEIFYSWLRNAEREGGCPIVIFCQSSRPGSEQLHFSSVRESQVP